MHVAIIPEGICPDRVVLRVTVRNTVVGCVYGYYLGRSFKRKCTGCSKSALILNCHGHLNITGSWPRKDILFFQFKDSLYHKQTKSRLRLKPIISLPPLSLHRNVRSSHVGSSATVPASSDPETWRSQLPPLVHTCMLVGGQR